MKPANPRCKIHNCAMRAHEEVVPFFALKGRGQGARKTTRTVYRCPRKNCHFVASGQAEYVGSPQQRQKMRELAKEWNKPISAWRYEDVARAMAQAKAKCLASLATA